MDPIDIASRSFANRQASPAIADIPKEASFSSLLDRREAAEQPRDENANDAPEPVRRSRGDEREPELREPRQAGDDNKDVRKIRDRVDHDDHVKAKESPARDETVAPEGDQNAGAAETEATDDAASSNTENVAGNQTEQTDTDAPDDLDGTDDVSGDEAPALPIVTSENTVETEIAAVVTNDASSEANPEAGDTETGEPSEPVEDTEQKASGKPQLTPNVSLPDTASAAAQAATAQAAGNGQQPGQPGPAANASAGANANAAAGVPAIGAANANAKANAASASVLNSGTDSTAAEGEIDIALSGEVDLSAEAETGANTKPQEQKAQTARPQIGGGTSNPTDAPENSADASAGTQKTDADASAQKADRAAQINAAQPRNTDTAAPKTQSGLTTTGSADLGATNAAGATNANQTTAATVQLRAAPNAQAGAPQQSVPVGALAAHITRQAVNGNNRFQIRLDPPELGRVDVRLELTRDGVVNTHLTVERPETLDLLQRDARSLEQALARTGLNTKDGGLSFSLQDQSQSQEQSAQNGRNGGDFEANAKAHFDSDEDNNAVIAGQRYIATSGLNLVI